MIDQYDKSNRESILAHARKLVGYSLSDFMGIAEEKQIYQVDDKKKKGRYGLMLETEYFKILPNSRPEPDFPEVGLELKVSPLKSIRGNHLVSKERIVLSIIDYHKLVVQDFDRSDFWEKNKELLILFYMYETNQLPINYIVQLADIWAISQNDLEIITRDWTIIRDKVAAGLAHEISESDTYYLGACTKGANSSSIRGQPRSPIKAKQRAFSLKQSYVNHIIATFAQARGIVRPEKYGKLLSASAIKLKKTISEVILERFTPHYGKSIEQLSDEFGSKLNIKAKNFASTIINRILNIELGLQVEELVKAGIVVKVARVNANGLPKEDVSFPAFKYKDFAGINWEDSDFKEDLEQPFLFVFFKEKANSFILDKTVFWSMPLQDLQCARRVWVGAKWIVMHGKIIASVKNGKRRTRFPSIKNEIAHVRPHAQNANDCYPLPIPDIVSGAYEYTKHSFWLNKGYIKQEIYDL